MDNSLLEPTLNQQVSKPIYSVGALIAAAFFGGGIAACLMGLLCAHRLHKLARHGLFLGAMLLLILGGLGWAMSNPGLIADPDFRSNLRMVNRVVGFAMVAVIYLLFQREYRSMRVLGTDAPSPYLPVIATIVVGAGIVFGLTFWGVTLSNS